MCYLTVELTQRERLDVSVDQNTGCLFYESVAANHFPPLGTAASDLQSWPYALSQYSVVFE